MDVDGRGLFKKLYHIFLERLRKSTDSSVRLTRKPTDNNGGHLSKTCIDIVLQVRHYRVPLAIGTASRQTLRFANNMSALHKMAAVLRVDGLVSETEYVASQCITVKYRKFHEDRFGREGGAEFLRAYHYRKLSFLITIRKVSQKLSLVLFAVPAVFTHEKIALLYRLLYRYYFMLF